MVSIIIIWEYRITTVISNEYYRITKATDVKLQEVVVTKR